MSLQQVIRKTPNEIIALVFNEKYDTALKPTDFELVNVRENTDVGVTGNTLATIRVIDADSGYSGERDISYTRRDINDVMYKVEKHFPLASGELDIKSVVTALRNQYGLYIDETHIEEVSIDKEHCVVSFSATSPLFINKVKFTYLSHAEDLDELITIQNIGPIFMQDKDDQRANATYYSNPYNMSVFKSIISAMMVGDEPGDDFVTLMASITEDPWVDSNTTTEFNLRGSKLVYKGDPLGADAKGLPANIYYKSTAIIELSDSCNNLTGYLLINMN